MKATLKLELFGDNTRQQFRFYTNMIDSVLPGLGRVTMGDNIPPSSWAAEIVGSHDKYKYDRKFLRFKKDYSASNSKGSRGVFAWYILESGKYYDIKESVSWKNCHRYFAKVNDDGDILRVEESEVREWLKSL